MLRIVADLGNSRLKWGRIGGDGRLEQAIALPLDDPDAWDAAWQRWNPAGAAPSAWAIATVNPPVAERLDAFLEGPRCDRDDLVSLGGRGPGPPRRWRTPRRRGPTGPWRSRAPWRCIPPGGPGLVVSCGTAITVERIAADGAWQGGAIAPGLGLAARALHLMTAQLPLVRPAAAPPPWGRSTRPALEAGRLLGHRRVRSASCSPARPPGWRPTPGSSGPAATPTCSPPGSTGATRGSSPYLVLEGLARIASIRLRA